MASARGAAATTGGATAATSAAGHRDGGARGASADEPAAGAGSGAARARLSKNQVKCRFGTKCNRKNCKFDHGGVVRAIDEGEAGGVCPVAEDDAPRRLTATARLAMKRLADAIGGNAQFDVEEDDDAPTTTAAAPTTTAAAATAAAAAMAMRRTTPTKKS